MPVPRILQQIEHVVVLMLENRSFDNVVGWLYRSDAPAALRAGRSSPVYDGLNTGSYSNSYKGRLLPVTAGTGGAAQPLRVPRLDPHVRLPRMSRFSCSATTPEKSTDDDRAGRGREDAGLRPQLRHGVGELG